MLSFLLFTICEGVDLYNFENLQHYGYIKIGNQELPVMFDSGSTASWISASSCYSKGCLKNQRYDPNKSSTVTFLEMSFELEYNSGKLKGELVTETLTIDSFQIRNVEIGLVSSQFGSSFERLPFAGIIGIAPYQSESSLMSLFYTQYNISTITISLSKSFSDLGYIYFGGDAFVEMHKCTSEDFWEVPITKAMIGEVNLCKFTPCKAVIDTGTSVISLPSLVYTETLNKIKLKKDCSNAEIVQNLKIELFKELFEIESYEFIIYDEGICSLAFMKIDVPEPVGPLIVLGGTFLREALIFLDFLNSQIGIQPNFDVFPNNRLIKN